MESDIYNFYFVSFATDLSQIDEGPGVLNYVVGIIDKFWPEQWFLIFLWGEFVEPEANAVLLLPGVCILSETDHQRAVSEGVSVVDQRKSKQEALDDIRQQLVRVAVGVT